jgi:hypothetical protein
LLEKGRRIPCAARRRSDFRLRGPPRVWHSDYQISEHRDLRYVCLGGIRSTGLTASMALAEEALARLGSVG